MEKHIQVNNQPRKQKKKQTPLEKAQERFNRLAQQIEQRETENKRQAEQAGKYHQLHQQKIMPLLRQYASEKVLLVHALDAIYREHRFSKSQNRTYTEWVIGTLEEVAAFSDEAAQMLEQRKEELYQLLPKKQKEQYNKQETTSADSETAFTGEADAGSYQWDEEQFFHQHYHQPNTPEPRLPEQEDIGPLYKELAKKIHPDLEQDETRKAARHELMQQLTEARQKGDLYAMLRIKASLAEQPVTASLPLEQLQRYNKLLQQKLRQLEQQFARSVVGSMMGFGPSAFGDTDPEQEVNREVRTLKKTIRTIREERGLIKTREHLEQLLEVVKRDVFED